MSELIKTEAIVLRKIDYRDSSRIIYLFTKEFGKMTAIVKAARSAKSKYGRLLDILNHVQIIIYKKDSREIQLISDVDLIDYYPIVKEDFLRFKYANAIIELLFYLTVENEIHRKLFLGTVKAISEINKKEVDPTLIFAKYFLFFLKEIGYAISLEDCSYCHNKIVNGKSVFFSYDSGIICKSCKEDKLVSMELNKELFDLLICLKSKKNEVLYNKSTLETAIRLFEKFLKYNVTEFKGLKSLEM